MGDSGLEAGLHPQGDSGREEAPPHPLPGFISQGQDFCPGAVEDLPCG